MASAASTSQKFFKPSEFACRCKKCDGGSVSPDLIAKLERIREKLGQPIRITSGFRCEARQEELRRQGLETAKGVSQHQLGRAADINCAPEHFPELCRLAQEEFQSVGMAQSWLHVDLRDDKKRIWHYGS